MNYALPGVEGIHGHRTEWYTQRDVQLLEILQWPNADRALPSMRLAARSAAVGWSRSLSAAAPYCGAVQGRQRALRLLRRSARCTVRAVERFEGTAASRHDADRNEDTPSPAGRRRERRRYLVVCGADSRARGQTRSHPTPPDEHGTPKDEERRAAHSGIPRRRILSQTWVRALSPSDDAGVQANADAAFGDQEYARDGERDARDRMIERAAERQ